MTKEELLASEESEFDRSPEVVGEYEFLDLKELANHFVPKIAKFIPNFIFKHFRKLLHVDRLNDIFGKTYYKTGQEFLDYVCDDDIDIHLDFNGPGFEEMKNFVPDAPIMFASNHPYGGPEGVAIFRYIHREFPRARLLIQSFLKFIRPLSEICVYNGKNLNTLQKAVDEKRPLFYFPAGYCSRKLKNGEIFDYEWKSSFVRLAKKNKMPIFIMFTHGQLSKRTLRMTSLRKLLHIKFSFESMYLPDEVFKLEHSTIKITCGHMINPEVFTGDVSLKEWAQRLRQYCHELKTNPDAVFDPEKPATLPLM